MVSYVMSKKHRKTCESIFSEPPPANIKWHDIVSLFRHLGAHVEGGGGSRVRVFLRGVRAVFHRPHPQNETDRGTVRSVRRFLETIGVDCAEI